MNCVACYNSIKRDDMLVCTSCKEPFHYKCLNMKSTYFSSHAKELKRTWRCPSCVTLTAQRKGEDTPVRKPVEHKEEADVPSEGMVHISDSTPTRYDASSNCDFISYQQFAKLLDSKLDVMQSKLSDKFKIDLDLAVVTLKNEFNDSINFITNQITDIQKEHVTFCDRIKVLERENAELHSTLSSIKKQQPSLSELIGLQDTITQLKIESNEREQSVLLNDVEITGIPEQDGESTLHIITSVATKLGITLEQQDIVHASRVGGKRLATSDAGESMSSNNSHPLRPRPIVVRLVRRSIRNKILKNARIRRGITTADMDLSPHTPRPFYINERLTKSNRIIFSKSRDLAKAQNWRFVWTKDGRIHARRSETSEVHLLRSEKDISRVFKIVDESQNCT